MKYPFKVNISLKRNPPQKPDSLGAKAGLPPGTLVYVGQQRLQRPQINLMTYDVDHLTVKPDTSVELIRTAPKSKEVSWIDVDGIHDIDLIGKIGEIFDIHPMILEDVVNTNQRPRVEELDHYLYVVLKMIYRDQETDQIWVEQVSFILGIRHLLTFQEQREDVFQSVRERLKNDTSRLRKQHADYLLFSLMDNIIDNYFVVLEGLEDRIDDLELEVENEPTSQTLREIQDVKKEIIFLRKAFLPLRDVLNQLIRTECPAVNKKTRVFFKDLYDKSFQVIETVDGYRDMVNNLQELHLALNGHRMNEIMKVLTIIATLFIPLTFIAGIYGMNFQYMPELAWKWGYFGVWGLMLCVSFALLYYFKSKNWF